MNDKISLLDYYQMRCKDENWYNKYYRCGMKDDGSIFKIFSTNYRDLKSFEYYFNEFKKYIEIPRGEWPKKETTGQEILKQHVRNLVQSYLYISKRDEKGQLIYTLSKKGEIFDKMLKSDFDVLEKKFLIILFLINSCFFLTPKYLLNRTYEMNKKLLTCGISKNKLYLLLYNFLRMFGANEDDLDNTFIFKYDVVWLLSFFSSEDFVKLFLNASEAEKNELFEQTSKDFKTSSKKNVLAWKYKSTNFSRITLIDTAIIIYVSMLIEDYKMENHLPFYSYLVTQYKKIFKIDEQKVLNFINNNKSVFEVIQNDLFLISDFHLENYTPTKKVSYEKVEEKKITLEKIDATSKEGVEKLENVRQVLKILSKEKSNYHCALEEINNCKYFTSKEDNKNYLEIHHLIPREFSFDFDVTLEFVDNYIPLCPHCHKMIHLATDRERIGIINYLFNKRKTQLENNHIVIKDIKEIYKYYKLDDF